VAYEFAVTAPGYATTHFYRSPFPRSSAWVFLRPERIATADKDAGALVSFTRPRGYFDPQRDRMALDGQATPPGVVPGAGVASSRLKLPAGAQRPVAAEFNGERLVGQTWPASENRVTVLELHH
jgi:triacylglycerol lipase